MITQFRITTLIITSLALAPLTPLSPLAIIHTSKLQRQLPQLLLGTYFSLEWELCHHTQWHLVWNRPQQQHAGKSLRFRSLSMLRECTSRTLLMSLILKWEMSLSSVQVIESQPLAANENYEFTNSKFADFSLILKTNYIWITV